jgi:hypothetical protein
MTVADNAKASPVKGKGSPDLHMRLRSQGRRSGRDFDNYADRIRQAAGCERLGKARFADRSQVFRSVDRNSLPDFLNDCLGIGKPSG